MNITHVYKDSYPPVHGGIEQHIHMLAHQLKGCASPTVLVSGDRRSTTNDDGVLVHSVGAWGRLQGAPISPTLPYRIRQARAGLFHFHMPNPTGELAYLMSGSRVPTVATYHSDIVRQANALRVYGPFLHVFLRRVDRIIVTSPNYLASSPILPAYRDKCRVVPYGIDVDRFEPSAAIRARAEAVREQYGERLVLFAGVLRYYKGVEYLLRAMARVEGRLLVAGKGPESERLHVLAAELGIQDRVVWLPLLAGDDYVAVLHACDLFAFPSIYRSEAFGIVQLEAHACGKPVVCTSLGTGTDYVNQHGKTGLVVPPRDVDALAEALDRLLGDELYRAELGQVASTRVRNEFTRERMVESILDVYREALAVEGRQSEVIGFPIGSSDAARQ
jgi:rhamnosyl/mannosyltransferase